MTINRALIGEIMYRKDQGQDKCIPVTYKDDW